MYLQLQLYSNFYHYRNINVCFLQSIEQAKIINKKIKYVKNTTNKINLDNIYRNHTNLYVFIQIYTQI